MTHTIAVDFDGTICQHKFPACGELNHEVVEALNTLKQRGWQIIIHTVRVNNHWEENARHQKAKEMIEYLIKNNVPFDRIWGIDLTFHKDSTGEVDRSKCCWYFTDNGYEEDRLEIGKPLADVYLDDRALNFRGQKASLILLECRSLAGDK